MVVIAWLIGLVAWIFYCCVICMMFALPFVIIMAVLDNKRNPQPATPSRPSRRKPNHTPSGPGIMERVAARERAAAAAAYKAKDRDLVRKIKRERNPECARIYTEMLRQHRGG
jgi:hypothetical protein